MWTFHFNILYEHIVYINCHDITITLKENLQKHLIKVQNMGN